MNLCVLTSVPVLFLKEQFMTVILSVALPIDFPLRRVSTFLVSWHLERGQDEVVEDCDVAFCIGHRVLQCTEVDEAVFCSLAANESTRSDFENLVFMRSVAVYDS